MNPAADLAALDAAATLAEVESALVERRTAEARDLALAAHWADLHAADPQLGRGGRRVWQGEDRLIQVGGEGTPQVQDLCLSELAIARRVHPLAARKLVADALDLRHRLPGCWAGVQCGEVEAWVARRVANLTRPLGEVAVRLVDETVTEALATLSPARVFEIVQAKIIEADPIAHAAALAAEKRRRYVSLTRTDEFGLRHVIARVRAGDAVWVAAMIERVADLLTPRFPDGTSQDELRSEAFGWLARPADLLDLLTGGSGDGPDAARPRAVLYVHLHEAAVRSDHGVARIEDIGPVLSREIPAWLGHTHVTVRPVIDLADQVAHDAYEHPESLKERIRLRSPADSFPHANAVSRRLDLDHVQPYLAGTPGQTGDHNSQPLSRTGHRAKTHLGYRVRQLGPGDHVWQTPNHRYRRVNHLGTTALDDDIGSGLLSDDPVDQAVAQMTLDLRLTGRANAPRSIAGPARFPQRSAPC